MYSIICLLTAVVIFYSNQTIWLQKKWAIASVCLLTFLRLIFIFNTHTIYSNRLAFHKQTTAYCIQHHISKLCIANSDSLNNLLLMNWGLGYESILYSSLNKQHLTVSYFMPGNDVEFVYVNDTAYLKNTNNFVLSAFEKIDRRILPEKYFQFEHPSINYLVFPVVKKTTLPLGN
jgi:hypothetical protein